MDGLRSAGKVGSVHRLEFEDLCDPEAEFSLHNLGVNHLLKALPIYLGEAAVPNIVVIGAEVEHYPSPTDRLTPLIAASLNEAVKRIIDECMS